MGVPCLCGGGSVLCGVSGPGVCVWGIPLGSVRGSFGGALPLCGCCLGGGVRVCAGPVGDATWCCIEVCNGPLCSGIQRGVVVGRAGSGEHAHSRIVFEGRGRVGERSSHFQRGEPIVVMVVVGVSKRVSVSPGWWGLPGGVRVSVVVGSRGCPGGAG